MTLKNFLFFFLLILASVFFQSTSFDILVISGVKPDLVLIVVCYISLRWEEEVGTCLGFLLGFLQDVLSVGILGLNALTKTLFGFMCKKAERRLNTKNPIVQMLLIFIFSLLEGTFFLFILQVFHLHRGIHETILELVLPEAFYNMLLTPVLFWTINQLHRKWIFENDRTHAG
ncbi:MAG: rod shape-determining protein MreD [bacterium]